MSSDLPQSVDVAIVGAGISGLHAAYRLQQSDLDVVVLEGRDRVGGRLLSIPAGSGRVDVGATWFWPSEPLVVGLVNELGLAAFDQHLQGDMVFQQEHGATQRAGNQLDTPAHRLGQGMQMLPEALADRLAADTIRLGTVAREIRTTDDGLTVDTSDGAWNAAHVVIALPPALASTTITFDPPLPARFGGIVERTPVWMGSTVKVVAIYDDAFWRTEGLAGAAFSWQGPLREIHDMSGPGGTPAALFGFCALPTGAAAPTHDDVVEQLTALFGPRAREATEVHVMDWRTEVLTSPSNVEQLTDFRLFGHPAYQQPIRNGRLHWCSTETGTFAPGHVEGALQASARATEQILQSINNPRENS